MSIFVIGINHKTASLNLREKVYFASEKLPLYLQDLLSRGDVREAVLLSTCNRSELYCDAEKIQSVRDWFCAQTNLDRKEIEPALYVYQDERALAHIMEVACGLDSMVLGEPQILGQMKEAFAESCQAGAINNSFHRLFQQIFATAKEIRTRTAIGACPVSVASTSVRFAKEQFLDWENANVVLLGAGETTEILVSYLAPTIKKPLSLVNRNYEKAKKLLTDLDGNIFSLSELVPALTHADVVFSATRSATPIVTKKILEEVMFLRKQKPLLLIDIAVPRDIDPDVSSLPNVKLYSIDDLKTIIEKNLQGREHAAIKAQEMIRIKSQELISEIKSYDKAKQTIRAYRSQIEEICRMELSKAKIEISQGKNPLEVLEGFAYTFTQKLLHAPSVQLRKASVEGREELLRFASQLFSIQEHEIELL